MKEYQNLIGKITIAAAIIIVAFILANAIESDRTSAGSRLPGRRAPWRDGWAERKTCVNIFLIVMG